MLRAVRILRSVSFIRGLQVLVTALLATFLNAIIPLLFFLFIIMFIFSIIGYYWFGFDQTGDLENWGTIGRALLSLFTYVTVRGEGGRGREGGGREEGEGGRDAWGWEWGGG